MDYALKAHQASKTISPFKVSFSYSLIDTLFEAQFKVVKDSQQAWFDNPKFSLDYKENWGLWDFDVVEIFLQARSQPDEVQAPYLELQLSPRDQVFALWINKPRIDFHIPKECDFDHFVNLENNQWISHFKIDLQRHFKKGKSLYGGAFSCLGKEDRFFYSLNPNKELDPDFHRPELFLDWGEL